MTSTLTIHYTRALPGAGKTFLCRDFIKRSNKTIIRVDRDDLRMSLFGSYWGKGVKENVVTMAQDDLTRGALTRGFDVFDDNTNLSPRAVQNLEIIASDFDAQLVCHDLTHIPPWTCIENDLKRDRQVGAKAIWDMWERYLKPEHPGDPNLPHACLVDVDGTIAIHGDRGPFEWHRVGEDAVNHMVVKIVRLLSQDHKILIVSGRDAVCRPETTQWLIDNDIPHDALYMRLEGDSRKDAIVKLELLELIKECYFPALCIDDRQQVVDAYRHAGLPVHQVARGDF